MMLNQPFIKELLTALFYFFVIFNIIIRIIVTKKRKKKKKKKKNLKGGVDAFAWEAEAGGGLYKIFRDFLKIIWCIITFGYGKGCFQDKVEIPTVEQLWYETESGDDFYKFNDNKI